MKNEKLNNIILYAIILFISTSCSLFYDKNESTSSSSETTTLLGFTSDKLYNGVSYYISNDGDDNNSGLSASTPWKTISHVNSQQFAAGSSILFKKGDVWRESIKMNSSGNDDNYITYGSYGSGDKPQILGSASLTDWVKVNGETNVWSSVEQVSNPYDYWESQSWFVENDGSVTWDNLGHTKYGLSSSELISELNDEYDIVWVEDENSKGSIYIYCTEDPSNRYQSVEIPERDTIVYLLDQEYIAIDGLELRYANQKAVNEIYEPSNYLSGMIVVNCDIGYIGMKAGSKAFGLSVRHSDMYIGSNVIHDCGRRGISLYCYQTSPVTTIENVIIEKNHFYNGFHTTGVDCANDDSHVINNIVIRYNYFEGDNNFEMVEDDANSPTSNSVYMANSNENGTISDVYIYGNIFTYSHASSIKLGGLKNTEIYNNTFYDFNSSLYNQQGHVYLFEGGTDYDEIENITIKNNIFYLDADNLSNTNLMPIKLSDSFSDEVHIDNNLYYSGGNNSSLLLRITNGTDYTFGDWNSYQNETNFDINSVEPKDPLFSNPDKNDFSLKLSSPAIGNGIQNECVILDYEGNSYSNPPSIGALEY